MIVWDAEELLEASIRSIRKDVDYIVVVYQKVRIPRFHYLSHAY